MKIFKKIAFVLSVLLLLAGCKKNPSKAATKAGINFGAAITIGDALNPEKIKVITENYNTVVAENNMKWENIHPKRTFYNFGDMDAIANMAINNGMKVRGHTFMWHQQNAAYVSSIKDDDELKAHLEEHITKVMEHYKGKIYEYDVANEIFEENGSFRKSFWYNRFGEEIYEFAFEVAHKADPDAILILNDYNNENAGYAKSDAQYRFVKKMVEKGIPINGIGMQLHLQENLPFNKDAIRKNVQRYAELGLKVSFTEIDVRVKTPATPEAVKHQQEIFCDLLDIALTEPNVDTFVFWGVSDAHTWVPSTFPGYGDPLPLDRDNKPKDAMDAMVKML